MKNKIKITMGNYEEYKEAMKEFEYKNQRELERIEEEKRLQREFEYFVSQIPEHSGCMQYPTKVLIHIEYETTTPDYQGAEKNSVDIDMPLELYDEVFGFGEKRGK